MTARVVFVTEGGKLCWPSCPVCHWLGMTVDEPEVAQERVDAHNRAVHGEEA